MLYYLNFILILFWYFLFLFNTFLFFIFLRIYFNKYINRLTLFKDVLNLNKSIRNKAFNILKKIFLNYEIISRKYF